MDRRRLESMSRLARRYAAHQARRVLRSAPGSGLGTFVSLYRTDRLMGMPAAARAAMPAFSGCVGCGLCAFAADPSSISGPWTMAAQLGRSVPDIPEALQDLASGGGHDLEAARSACPLGIPFVDLQRYFESAGELMEGSGPRPVAAPSRRAGAGG